MNKIKLLRMFLGLLFFGYLVNSIVGISFTHAASVVPAGFQEEEYIKGLDTPTAMAFSPDGRLFISEKKGTLRVVKNNTLLSDPFISLDVDTFIERGLLGITFDPDFSTNRYLYIYYTTSSPTIVNRLSRFTANTSNPDKVEPNSEVVLIDNIPSDSGMHNGGALHFGNDGKLYVSVGDGGSDSSKAQDLTNLSGKILRINKDGSIPVDNPYVGQTEVRGEIWAYGLRNPFTFAFNPNSGLIYINDVGANVWEEINQGIKGGNYGWPTCEGMCSNSSFLNPIYADFHPQMSSITGAAFYTGTQFPLEYNSDYFFGDYVKNFIRRMDSLTNEVSNFATNTPSPVDIRMGPDQSLYYLSIGEGAVYKINYGITTPTPTVIPTVTPTPLSGQGLKAKYFNNINLTGTSITRTDQNIDFDWGLTSPIMGINPDYFSVSWEGQILSQSDGEYTFYVNSDDGVRLWIDNKLVIDKWIHQSATENAGSVILNANSKYNIRLEYFEGNYSASVHLLWKTPSDQKQIIPNSRLFTTYNNSNPNAVISSPIINKKYYAGETISYSGNGTDIEDKQLPDSSYNWRVVFHHGIHTHPFLDAIPSGKNGNFTIPDTGETATNVWYRLYLTVTDLQGNETQVYRDIHPEEVDLTFNTNPASGQITIDGQPQNSPFTIPSVVGMKRIIGAAKTFEQSGKTYNFAGWSDNGERTHTIITLPNNTTYTASYFNELSQAAGLLGTYYDDINLTGKANQRIDQNIDFVWNQDQPIESIYKETFSVRWTGFILPPKTGDYTFHTFTDDGVRLWVDDKLVIDNWIDQSRKEVSGGISLTGGKKVKIKMEFYDRNIDAVARLFWSGPEITKQIVPNSVLETGLEKNGNGLQGTYYDTKEFGGISKSRIDPIINFNWGQASPMEDVNNETFSVRWTGYIKPATSEYYSFHARTDDGVRVWVNNILIIDNLNDQQTTEKSGNIELQKDIYYPIRIDYYDNYIDAVAELSWSSNSVPKQIIPTKNLFSN